jgi:hypothetical protein
MSDNGEMEEQVHLEETDGEVQQGKREVTKLSWATRSCRARRRCRSTT